MATAYQPAENVPTVLSQTTSFTRKLWEETVVIVAVVLPDLLKLPPTVVKAASMLPQALTIAPETLLSLLESEESFARNSSPDP